MNKRKQRTLGIFALAVALISTTVAYAALSTTLSISGSVTKKGGTWGVQIVDVSSFTTSGSATTTSTKPTLTGNTSLSFSANLYKPNDEVSFTFKVKNTGSVDAKIDDNSTDWNFTPTMKCEGGYFTSSDFSDIIGGYPQGSNCDNNIDITCQMLYDGVVLKKSASSLSKLDVKAGSTSGTFTVKCKYDNVSSISASDETRSFSVSLPYVQV